MIKFNETNFSIGCMICHYQSARTFVKYWWDSYIPYESLILSQHLDLISPHKLNISKPRFESYDPWSWQIDQLWYNSSISRFRVFYCKNKTKNGIWVHKRVRVLKFEYINEYGSTSRTGLCLRRPVLVYVLKILDPYSLMYSNCRTRTRLCTQKWLNIDDSYGTLE